MTSILRRSHPEPSRPRHRDPDATVVVFTGHDPANAELTAMMDSLAADATSARLFELERAHEDLTQLHVDLLAALLARAPEGWHGPDPATSALSYLRFMEDDMDHCGRDRRPPWERPASDEGTPFFDALIKGRECVADPNAPVPAPTGTGAGTSGEAGTAASPELTGTTSPEDAGNTKSSGPVCAPPSHAGPDSPGEPEGGPDCAEGGS